MWAFSSEKLWSIGQESTEHILFARLKSSRRSPPQKSIKWHALLQPEPATCHFNALWLMHLLCLFQYIHHSPGNSKRGFGIDCAILSCQVYISQILVASALGGVVDAVGTVRVIPMVASAGSFLGFLTATFLVIYPDVGESPKDEQKGLAPPETTESNGTNEEKPTVIKLSRKEATPLEVESESTVWVNRRRSQHIPIHSVKTLLKQTWTFKEHPCCLPCSTRSMVLSCKNVD